MRSGGVNSSHVTTPSCELKLCKSSNVPKSEFSAFYSHLQVTSGQMTSLPGHYQSHDIICCLVTAASCELQPCRSSEYPKRKFLALYSCFQVTSGQITSLPGQFRSCEVSDVNSGDVTNSFGELKPCKSSNVPTTRVFGLLQPLPDDFNQMTSLPGQFRSSEAT